MEAQLARLPLAGYKNVWEFMQTMEYNNSSDILYLEQQLYNLLQKTPEEPNLLVLLLHEQIMNNRGQRARSLAYKIWETGGTLEPYLEKLYIDDLMNLGLVSIAQQALTPYIENIENVLPDQSFLLLKYAVLSGSMPLLEHVLGYLSDYQKYNILRAWSDLNDELHATSHISPIMNRLLENVKDAMAGFSYNCFSDRDVPDIEFVFYVDNSITNYEELRENMHLQISSYCAAHKIDDLLNLSVLILPISRRKCLAEWFTE